MNTVTAVKEALQRAASNDPGHVDARAGRNLAPRYMEHGKPCCLVAVVLAELGISTGVLRQLDQEGGRGGGGGVKLRNTAHPIRGRFDPVAWQLLAAVQARQDKGESWQSAVDSLLHPRTPCHQPWKDPVYPWNSGPHAPVNDNLRQGEG